MSADTQQHKDERAVRFEEAARSGNVAAMIKYYPDIPAVPLSGLALSAEALAALDEPSALSLRGLAAYRDGWDAVRAELAKRDASQLDLQRVLCGVRACAEGFWRSYPLCLRDAALAPMLLGPSGAYSQTCALVASLCRASDTCARAQAELAPTDAAAVAMLMVSAGWRRPTEAGAAARQASACLAATGAVLEALGSTPRPPEARAAACRTFEMRSELYAALGDPQRARAELESAATLAFEDSGAKSSLLPPLRCRLASTMLAAGEYPEAVAIVLDGVAAPETPEERASASRAASLFLAMNLFRVPECAKAIKMISRASDTDLAHQTAAWRRRCIEECARCEGAFAEGTALAPLRPAFAASLRRVCRELPDDAFVQGVAHAVATGKHDEAAGTLPWTANHRPPACTWCSKAQGREPEAQLSRCSACRVTRYCSKECQKAAWKSHKEMCKALKKEADRTDAALNVKLAPFSWSPNA